MYEEYMKKTNPCDISFSNIHEDVGLINFLVDSEKRKNLLLLLRGSSKTLDEIREHLKVTSSGIIPQIRKMEERHLIARVNRRYELTEMGTVIADYYCNFEGIEKIFNNNMKFWDEHKISAIPGEFRIRLHELGNYEIVRSTSTDIFKPHQEDMRNLVNARLMKGISPVMHPDYPRYICNLAEKGMDVYIIITDEILEILEKTYMEELKKCSGLKKICLSVCHEKIEFSFLATDHFLSLRPFLKDGNYDFHEKIMSFDRSAIRWGEDLFNYYVRRSEKIVLSDI
jgi:predicted transcriptional regulator